MAKPLNRPAKPLLPRERVWSAMRTLRCFTVAAVEREVSRSGRLYDPPLRAVREATVLRYIQRLQLGGYIKLASDYNPAARKPRIWSIAAGGVDAPLLDPNGRDITTGRWRENVWRAMRIARDAWTCAQLAELSTTPEHPVRASPLHAYVAALVRAGYVDVTTPATRSDDARLRLVRQRWTGPRPPQVLKLTAVYDRNTGQVHTLDDPAEVADAH